MLTLVDKLSYFDIKQKLIGTQFVTIFRYITYPSQFLKTTIIFNDTKTLKQQILKKKKTIKCIQ